MSNKREDCYFYFYSTCTKGDSCPYRHCEAALGNETVCVLWQEGRCFRSGCRFRHMEINKKRSEIPCYWENQPVGCQKLNCAFHHNKGRFVDGLFLPPSKNQLSEEGDESKMPVQQSSEVSNRLRVVSTGKSVVSTKQDKDGGLNFGIKTLEEIKSKKKKEKPMQQADCPSEVAAQTQTHPDRERENVQTVLRTVTSSTKEENATKPAVEFRVKTLEEIHLEKASQRKGDIWPKLKVTVSCTANDSSPGAKPSPAISIKTFSEVLAEKKQRQMEEERIKTQKERLSKSKHDSEPQKQGSIVIAPAKRKVEEPFGKAKDLGEVRIKTLEEIKKEKALRMQQTLDSTVKTQLQAERAPAERRLFCITKPTAPGNEEEPRMELTSSSRDGTADATVKKTQQQKRKSQEEQVVVASAREEMGEAKALVTANPASPVKTGKTHPLRKRKLMGTEEIPAKRLRLESSVLSQPVEQRVKASAPILPKETIATGPERECLNRSELQLENQAASTLHTEIASPTSSHVAEKTCRPSSTGSGIEDEFEKLVWEGQLEAEIDLDPGKDDDELLRELSELIDS